MLIKSLSLKNFQCYCGELDQNHFCFKNGLNLIIGNNGNGKSKVFDGFYWVLYDQIFDTDIRQFTPTSVYGEKLISDKVTRNCEVGDTATAEACLVVESSQGREYRLTRVFHCTKLSDTEWMKERSILLIEEKKKVLQCIASQGQDYLDEYEIPVTQGVMGKAIQQKKCIRVGDVRKDVREIERFYF